VPFIATVAPEPGDTRYSMLHYAGHLTDDPRKLQVAVSFMWLPERQFNPHCPSSNQLPPVTPLAVFDTVWYYSGFGAIPQGQFDPYVMAQSLTNSDGSGFIAENIFAFLPNNLDDQQAEISYVVDMMEVISKFAGVGKKVPFELWLHLSTAADLNRLGCNANETYIPRPLVEVNRMLKFLESL
jgi:hypothetical protein